jgi:hypothetical protein
MPREAAAGLESEEYQAKCIAMKDRSLVVAILRWTGLTPKLLERCSEIELVLGACKAFGRGRPESVLGRAHQRCCLHEKPATPALGDIAIMH